MPNFDGGHYFLTVLAPVRVELIEGDTQGRSRSHRHQLAEELALLPTGRQTAVSPPDAEPSPFAGNTLNHFVRFVIIDGPPYNGRVASDTLYEVVRDINPLIPQKVDRLSVPYLLFAADFDATDDSDAAVRAYTDELWRTTSQHLIKIFSHCYEFNGVDNADKFYAYIRRCQVETTMPYNDYWPDGLDVGSAKLPTGALIPAAVAAGGLLVVWLLALALNGLFVVTDLNNDFARSVSKFVGWGALLVPLLIAAVALIAYGLYRSILKRGHAPFAAAPGCDLPSVLKSLYLQQHFTAFAIKAQRFPDAATLHAEFGKFLAAVKPDKVAEATQPAGEIKSL